MIVLIKSFLSLNIQLVIETHSGNETVRAWEGPIGLATFYRFWCLNHQDCHHHCINWYRHVSDNIDNDVDTSIGAWSSLITLSIILIKMVMIMIMVTVPRGRCEWVCLVTFSDIEPGPGFYLPGPLTLPLLGLN